MRILCLFFPRLATDLVSGTRPGKEVVLIDGHGDEAMVTASSAARVAKGMSSGQARVRAPHAAFLPDNAGDCLDELQRLTAIIRKNATPNVAIGGRDHLFVDLEGVNGTESAIAARLLTIVGEWCGTEVRGGLASSRAVALEAARVARTSPVIDTSATDDAEPPVVWQTPHEAISVAVAGGPGASSRLDGAFARLATILAGREEGFRELRLSTGDGARARVTSRNPRHTAAEARALIDGHPLLATLDAAGEVAVTLTSLSPDVRVQLSSQPMVRRERPERVPMRRLRQHVLPLAS